MVQRVTDAALIQREAWEGETHLASQALITLQLVGRE